MTRTIIELCLEENQRPGLRVPMRWWDQAWLDLLGLREAVGEYRDGDRDSIREG